MLKKKLFRSACRVTVIVTKLVPLPLNHFSSYGQSRFRPKKATPDEHTKKDDFRPQDDHVTLRWGKIFFRGQAVLRGLKKLYSPHFPPLDHLPRKILCDGAEFSIWLVKTAIYPNVPNSDMRVRPTERFPLVPSSSIPQLNQLLIYSWVYTLETPFRTHAYP